MVVAVVILVSASSCTWFCLRDTFFSTWLSLLMPIGRSATAAVANDKRTKGHLLLGSGPPQWAMVPVHQQHSIDSCIMTVLAYATGPVHLMEHRTLLAKMLDTCEVTAVGICQLPSPVTHAVHIIL